MAQLQSWINKVKELNMKPVLVAESPVLISSGEDDLLIWLVVVQEVTKNRRTTNKQK
jgi:hypothetical protein